MADGSCTDPKCPHHGSLRVRGAVLQGKVASARAAKTAVVVVPHARLVRKYERYEKRRSKIHAHVPPCTPVREGDRVEIAECRKLSRTKAFVVTKVLAAPSVAPLAPH
jgi:small subunit ribosomal protein S17